MREGTAERSTDGAVAAMVEVRRAFETSGYADLVACFTPWLVNQQAWKQASANTCDPDQAMLELFLLGRQVPITRLPESLVDVLPHLAAAGLCKYEDELVTLGGLALHRFQGKWIFAQSNQVSPTMYLGDDSTALAARLEARPGTALDLCAGPGIQSLVCASRGMDVVAAEINPVAAALGAANARVNGLEDRVQVRVGDLYACTQDDRRFELVVANPPLLPIPNGVGYPFVGDGGPDGLNVTRRILAGLPAHLATTGTAQLIGMTLSDGYFPHCLPELRTWCRDRAMDVIWTTTHHPTTARGGWWVEGVARTSAGHTGQADPDEVAAVADQLTAGYRDLDATAVCTYFLRVVPGTGTLRYIDVSVPDGLPGLWYV